MIDIEAVFKEIKTTEKMDELIKSSEETAVILRNDKDDSSYFRLSVLDTVENIANEIVTYAGEVRDILSNINTSSALMPELLDELQRSDREMMLEYLNLIETNTRSVTRSNNGEGTPADGNQLSLIMNSVAVSITDALEQQRGILEGILDNSDFERNLIESEEDSFEGQLVPQKDEEEEKKVDGGGLMGFIGSLATGWSKLPNFVKALGKGGLIGAAVIGTGMFIKDLYDAFSDTDKLKAIAGRTEGALTNAEKSSAAIASAIESFTGGLINAKTTYDLIHGGVDLIQRGLDQIFDPDKGILGSFTLSLLNLVESGDWSQFTSDIGDSLMAFPEKVIEKIKEWWVDLVDLTENVLGKEFTEGIKNVTDFATKRVTDFGDSVYDGVTDFFGGDSEGDSASEIIQKSEDGVSNEEKAAKSISSRPVNRIPQSKADKLSKERADNMANLLNPPQMSTPIVQTVNNNNYSSVTREDGLSKQIQLMGL